MFSLMKYLNARRLRHRLHRLDDRMLKDIGLARADIERIVGGNSASSHASRKNIHIF